MTDTTETTDRIPPDDVPPAETERVSSEERSTSPDAENIRPKQTAASAEGASARDARTHLSVMTEIQEIMMSPTVRAERRRSFKERLEQAVRALGIPVSEEEKRTFAHAILEAWEQKGRCAACTKTDEEAIGCGALTVLRDGDKLRTAITYCDKHYRGCNIRRQKKLLGDSYIGERFAAHSFDTFEVTAPVRDAYRAFRTLADRFYPGTRGILLQGGCGCGKTHLAAALVGSLIERGCRAVIIPVPRLFEQLKSYFGDAKSMAEFRSELIRADLLVLDDLGAEKSSDWSREQLFLILNDRYEHMRTTVVTTNLSPDRLAKHIGQRSYSRLVEMTIFLAMQDYDRRMDRYCAYTSGGDLT